MTSIDMESLLTIIYVLVDDWYQVKGQAMVSGKPGVKPRFSDSEMLTLMLAQDFIPYPGETQFVGFVHANLGHLFPQLIDQSQFNRRGRGLVGLLERLRREWLVDLTGGDVKQVLLDTKPVPVMGHKRSKRHSDFAGSASYGYCAGRNLHYFGYKLVLLTDLDGLPLVYDLVPANVDERQAAESVLWRVSDCDVFGDKGFLSDAWQAEVRQQTGNRVWTAKRTNQTAQNPATFDRLLNRIRERIEGTFHQLQNTGRNLERLLAKTVHGLCTRVALKVACYTLKVFLRRHFHIDVQSFSISH
jgi:hypothetical protein